MKYRNINDAGRFALTGVAFAACCMLATPSWSLGLGRLAVQSALGEGLRAEIDVTSLAPEEAATLQLRVAGPEAYQAAGVDYNPVLAATRVTLQRRPDGRSVLRLSSDRAVVEPFLDVILEANWATGRLMRAYTLLLDPPTLPQQPMMAAAPTPVTITPAPAPAPAPATASPAPAAAPAAQAAPAPAHSERAAATPAPQRATTAPVRPAPEAAPAPRAEPPARAAAPAPADASAGSRQVRVARGDTLSRIAERTRPASVSLDQMLVALFRANPDAFMGENMNRLKAGVVLDVPTAEAAQQLARAEAREVIVAQSADFDAYRRRLAGGVGRGDAQAASARQDRGTVQARVEDRRRAAAEAPDRLTLAQPEAAPASAQDAAKATQAAREAEARAAAARVAELARNVEELRRLQASAGTPAAGAPAAPAAAPRAGAATPPATTPAGAAPTIVAQAPVPPAPPPSAPTPAPSPSATPLPAPAASVPPVSATTPAPGPAATPAPAPAATPAPAPAATPAPAPSPAPASAPSPAPEPAPSPAPEPARAPQPTAPAPAAETEGGFLASLLDNPIVPALGGVVVLLLAGLGVYRLRGRAKGGAASGETSFLESRAQPDSFFGASGGQHVDTREAQPSGAHSSMSYSLSQLDAIGDVDPVAEADVYLAYGRDLQAEEILKEALRATPDRQAIRVKLLEVYAKRRDTKGFELLATQLYSMSGGQGEEWLKAQELGRGLDADNPLYQPGGQPQAAMMQGGQMVEPLGASTMPATQKPETSLLPDISGMPSSLGLDLDLSGEPTRPGLQPGDDSAGVLVDTSPAPLDEGLTLDLPAPRGGQGVDLHLDLGGAATLPTAKPPGSGFGALDFDLDAATPATQPARIDAPATQPLPDLDFAHSQPGATPSDFGSMSDAESLSRKMDLAEEFRQIGDIEGARDLLEEVVAKSDGALRTKAQGMLDRLA